ncbi:glycosyltransferase family 4 protein [Streptomyces radiopugnans]|uniref:glycosyltransferase family 4 protein n=1 Tax=Streptomyces radiopugnans TaxID=403935 RepID=UPI003F1B0790
MPVSSAPVHNDNRPVELGLLVDSDAFGGAEVYVRHLLRRLPPGFRCRLVVAEPVAHHFADLANRCAEVTVVPLARGRRRAPEVEQALAEQPVDVWHVNLVDPGSNRAVLAAASACAPTVATLHMPGRPEDATAELVACYRRLAAVVAVSAEIADVLRTRLRVPTARVVRIRNGVDIPPAAGPADGCHGPARIGAVGRLTEQKGFDVLLAAVDLLVRRGHEIAVDVAGEGRDRPALEETAAGLPVSFRGFVEDVPAFLRGLDLFCLPSRREALPLALLEAMAHALPCVVTAVGDIPEAVGEAVRLVPPDDPRALAAALEALLRDARGRRELGERARRLARRGLGAEDMVAATAAVLSAAARTAPRRPGGPVPRPLAQPSKP